MYLLGKGWENFNFLGELYCRDLISFFGEGGRPIFFYKAISDQYVNSKIVDGKIMFHVCMLTFLTFTTKFFI